MKLPQDEITLEFYTKNKSARQAIQDFCLKAKVDPFRCFHIKKDGDSWVFFVWNTRSMLGGSHMIRWENK
jgi:hypothetical protein